MGSQQKLFQVSTLGRILHGLPVDALGQIGDLAILGVPSVFAVTGDDTQGLEGMPADVILDDGVGNEAVGGAVSDESHAGGLATGQLLGEELGLVGVEVTDHLRSQVLGQQGGQHIQLQLGGAVLGEVEIILPELVVQTLFVEVRCADHALAGAVPLPIHQLQSRQVQEVTGVEGELDGGGLAVLVHAEEQQGAVDQLLLILFCACGYDPYGVFLCVASHGYVSQSLLK